MKKIIAINKRIAWLIIFGLALGGCSENKVPTHQVVSLGLSAESPIKAEKINLVPGVSIDAEEICALRENPHKLCLLPEGMDKTNSKNLDSKLFAILYNSVNEAFYRRIGAVEVKTTNGAEQSLREFDYDITSAFDEKENLIPDAEIEAYIKTTTRLQKDFNYGESDSRAYEVYGDFEAAFQEIKIPFFEKGLLMENLSYIEHKEENGNHYFVTKFDPEKLKTFLKNPVEGNIVISAIVNKEGNLKELNLEQSTVEEGNPKILFKAEYLFK